MESVSFRTWAFNGFKGVVAQRRPLSAMKRFAPPTSSLLRVNYLKVISYDYILPFVSGYQRFCPQRNALSEVQRFGLDYLHPHVQEAT